MSLATFICRSWYRSRSRSVWLHHYAVEFVGVIYSARFLKLEHIVTKTIGPGILNVFHGKRKVHFTL